MADFLSFVVLSFLVAATINDLKKREVPNWVNYGLAILGVAFALLSSLIYLDWSFLAFSAAGLAGALLLAAVMFYTGQWGGGDSKLLIGMGAALSLPFAGGFPFVSRDALFVAFLFNLVMVSFFYAVSFVVFFAFRNPGRVRDDFLLQLKSKAALAWVLSGVSVAGLAVMLLSNNPAFRFGAGALVVALPFSLFISGLARAVERVCMLKKVSPLSLTEGDWIAKDVIVNGSRICGPSDLGVDKRQIRLLISLYRRKKLSRVLIKEGIPFAPVFLIAYFLAVFFGNILFYVL